jgi:cardiolipin synthase A/B
MWYNNSQMTVPSPNEVSEQDVCSLLTEQVFSRTAGAPPVAGNRLRLLKDAKENYPAWLEAMASAETWIHFESYVIHGDDLGYQFADVLAAKAREGIRVRVIYDWLGGFGNTSRRFWQRLREAGVEVRCFNPPRLESPLSWITRDHRKMIGVDGKIAFVTGLCVGAMWAEDPRHAIDPWRDTGIEVKGPAVADIEEAFAQIWAATGGALRADEIPDRGASLPEGDVTVRVVASVPNSAGLYRLDQQIAAVARSSLWLTDAYYLGATPYVQALRAAARDGVDVRLLVPGATDIPILRALSRLGYKPLLEAGVRVFEWNGSMIHAKTAVADGRWARVGSTNLNLASWINNYELDVVVENEDFAAAMEGMYLDDLKNATEIVLSARQKVRPLKMSRRRRRLAVGPRRGSVGRVSAGAIRIGNTVGAAITNRRVLGPAEAQITFAAGLALACLALLAVLFPRWVTVPFAVASGWLGIAMFVKSWKLHRTQKKEMVDQSVENPKTGANDAG